MKSIVNQLGWSQHLATTNVCPLHSVCETVAYSDPLSKPRLARGRASDQGDQKVGDKYQSILSLAPNTLWPELSIAVYGTL